MFSDLTTEELLYKLEELGDRVPAELIHELLSRGKEIVEPMSRVLQERKYWEASDDKLWMPLHAVKLLGMLAYLEALPQLINSLVLAVETDDEWVMEDLPAVFGRIGPPAVKPLMEFILAHKGENRLWWARSAASNGLIAIVLRHLQEKERILSFLHSLFLDDEDPEFLGLVTCDLLDLHEPSSFPVIEEAFNRGFIEKGIISKEDFLQEREEPQDKEALAVYDTDLLKFYDPDEISKRQARWEEERKEREQQEALKRENREKSIDRELKRLEVVMELGDAGMLPLIKKTGRNEPCPCGSGKKFKKCHLPLIGSLPPKQILGEDNYAEPDYLHRASPYDPLLVLENLTALAFEAEDDGDVTTAFEIFRKLEPLAEKNEKTGDLLHNWERVCYNHPELNEKGLAIIRRLQSFYHDKDREQYAHASMDLADYLHLLDRWEEGREEYERILKDVPDLLFIHIRFARFLEKGNRIDEAISQYKQVLWTETAGWEDQLTAMEELKKLIARQGIAPDAQTKEAFERIEAKWQSLMEET